MSSEEICAFLQIIFKPLQIWTMILLDILLFCTLFYSNFLVIFNFFRFITYCLISNLFSYVYYTISTNWFRDHNMSANFPFLFPSKLFVYILFFYFTYYFY